MHTASVKLPYHRTRSVSFNTACDVHRRNPNCVGDIGTYYLLNSCIIVCRLLNFCDFFPLLYLGIIFVHFSETGKIASDIDLLTNKSNG